MHLKILIIAVLSLFICNAMAAELTVPPDKAVIMFDTKLGKVAFAHEKHAGLKITECKTCHHKLEPTDTAIKPCHECHQHKPKGSKGTAKADVPPFTKTAFHTRCIGCHEYTVSQGMEAGPLKKKCKLCHIKEKK